MIQFQHILNALSAEKAIPTYPVRLLNVPFHGAFIDSRQVIPGSIFFAIPGEQTDGHNYVKNAFDNGAMLAIVEKEIEGFPTFSLDDIARANSFPVCLKVENSLETLQNLARYWAATLQLKVVGITGSVGKSSTKELVTAVLRQKFSALKNRGNYNNEIGLPMSVLEAGLGNEIAVLEMGFYVPGEIAFLCDIAKPIVGVVTNIGTVHAERAGSREMIAKGKAELVQALPPNGTAILNDDDDLVRAMAKKTAAKVLFYGLTPHADLYADQIKGLGLNGVALTFHYQGQDVPATLPLIGQHSVYTALRAAAVGLTFGMNWQEIIAGLQQADAQLRLTATRLPNGATILDDSYNAAPESTCAALDLLHEVTDPAIPQRHIAVLGEMYELGQYELSGHTQVGRHAVETCDILIGVGDRSKIITETALKAGMDTDSVFWMPDVPQTIDLLRKTLMQNDVILIKGSHGLRMDRITWALERNA
ncbi:MAG: UDP-N-acetylmuramoyl-tripeptide--D-alanyl-D-alanine ligase [Anaerolineae bacterium]|jgi:UDP-N-acetylmuramoyl-tripeptide--D-alanyl-D-alanine ligase|nr:UDP-N-acetylmuramoyl-tripeptide--D-alanyl-D-alanine ligase [Anaerolineae bacterium]